MPQPCLHGLFGHEIRSGTLDDGIDMVFQARRTWSMDGVPRLLSWRSPGLGASFKGDAPKAAER